MKIAVLDYASGNVDIITVDKAFINDRFNGDVESFLFDDLGYDRDNTHWMSDVKTIRIVDNDLLNQIL